MWFGTARPLAALYLCDHISDQLAVSPVHLNPPRLVSSKEGCRRTSLSRASYRLMALGAFPKPAPRHGTRKAWIESEVAWVASRIAARDAQAHRLADGRRVM